MSKPTTEQLEELFRQITLGLVTKETIQEVINRAEELALSQLISQIIAQAEMTARQLADPLQKVRALIELAVASKNSEALDEVFPLIENLASPDVDFAAMIKLRLGPDNCINIDKWPILQARRIADPYQRCLRLSEIAPLYVGRNPDSGDVFEEAESALRLVVDDEKRNKLWVAITKAHASGHDFFLARSRAELINMPYFWALAFVNIFRFSGEGNDFDKIFELEKINFISDYKFSHILSMLVEIFCEKDDLQKAWEIFHRIESEPYRPYAYIAIIKASVRLAEKNSLNKAMHYLLPYRLRHQRTEGHLLIAAGEKELNREYRAKILRSIGLCQSEYYRAGAYASLACLSRNPSDLKQAWKELKSIKDNGKKFLASVEVISNFYQFKKS